MSNEVQTSSKITYHDSIYSVPDEYLEEEDIVKDVKEEIDKNDSSGWNFVSEYKGKGWDSIY